MPENPHGSCSRSGQRVLAIGNSKGPNLGPLCFQPAVSILLTPCRPVNERLKKIHAPTCTAGKVN
jgi:hypothetical protein